MHPHHHTSITHKQQKEKDKEKKDGYMCGGGTLSRAHTEGRLEKRKSEEEEKTSGRDLVVRAGMIHGNLMCDRRGGD